MRDDLTRFQTSKEIETSGEQIAHYMRKRRWCLCLHCVTYVCDNQNELTAAAVVAIQRQTGVPCLARAHEELYAPPRPSYRVTPLY